MFKFTLLILPFTLSVRGQGDEKHLDVSWSPGSPEFSIILNGLFPIFNNTDTFIHRNGKKLSYTEGTLQLQESVQSQGSDLLGEYTEVKQTWSPGDACLETSVRSYSNNMIVLSQNITCTLQGTSVHQGYEFVDSVTTGFPVLGFAHPANFLSYGGFMGGWASMTTGNAISHFNSIRGGEFGGPLLVFYPYLEGEGSSGGYPFQTNNYVLISPLAEFMSSSVATDNTPGRERLQFGVMGSVAEIPEGSRAETVLVWGSRLREVFAEWGKALLNYHGKREPAEGEDVLSDYLSYWTDNGAYYYYNTLSPDTSYAETIVEIGRNLSAADIPVRFINYDSWWYRKGIDLGTVEWIPLPDIFPDGLEALYAETGLQAVAHNRYWAVDNVYATDNGGQYEFVIDDMFERAIPRDPQFWRDFFRNNSDWGLVVYEQDWQDRQFVQMVATHTDISLAKNWLNDMSKGAEESNITIQYCMTLPREVLQSVECDAVRRLRVSGDYLFSENNWRIGVTTLMAKSLGLAPFKNVFWTSTNNPGNKFYYNCMEVTNSTDPNLPWSLTYLYAGNISTTRSGHACLPWHQLDFHWKFPIGDIENNYCRSIPMPGSQYLGRPPFCFYNASLDTPEETWLWEECDIPACDKDCTRPGIPAASESLPPCAEYTEPSPALQAAVAVLSGGGVGIGDRLGNIDTSLVTSTCRGDGLILGIEQPLMATPLQLDYMSRECTGRQPYSCGGEVWSGYQDLGNFRHHVVLVAENRIALSANLHQLDIQTKPDGAQLVAYSRDLGQLKLVSESTVGLPLQLAAREFQVIHLAPAIQRGTTYLAILGELAKISPVSGNRLTNLTLASDTSVELQIVGIPGEEVTLSIAHWTLHWDTHQISEITCTLDEAGEATTSVEIINQDVEMTCA